MRNEEDENNWEKKTMAKVYDLNSDEELNGDSGKVYHNNSSGNDNEQQKLIEKGQPIKKKNKNKSSSPTVKETFLKAIHNKETKEEDKDETIDTSYNK